MIVPASVRYTEVFKIKPQRVKSSKLTVPSPNSVKDFLIAKTDEPLAVRRRKATDNAPVSGRLPVAGSQQSLTALPFTVGVAVQTKEVIQ